MDKMKFNDEYIVWAVALFIIVGALVYSWGNGSREYMESQKCWGPETPMSAATGYPSDDGGRDFQTYLKYVGDELKKQGKCPVSENSMNCVKEGVKEGLQSLDMAKSYCSTVNCTAIFFVKDHPYVGTGTIYIPATSAFGQTLPRGLDGKPIQLPNPPPTLILPIPCASSTSASSSLTLKDDIGDDKVLPQTSTPATASISAPTGPGDSYVLKSSLVPCTCTIHSMGCEKHAGSKPSSSAPGDKDPFPPGKSDQLTAQPQKGLMRPFSSAFSNQGEPTGFLASFAAFG